MSSLLADRPILHPNFAVVCLSLEAWDFRREHKARRQYTCRFCSRAIAAGTRYRAHSDKAAHIECIEEFRKVTPNAPASGGGGFTSVNPRYVAFDELGKKGY